MPCVQETEKATEMPRGVLPPHLQLILAQPFRSFQELIHSPLSPHLPLPSVGEG